ncbi:hypothetical protein P8452_51512 [Trifolium repens]|nr:hypothetical protein P8452_51512 [Trifolium repens]
MDFGSPTSFTYDVFISFRGIDTRFGFTGYLHKNLSDKGIRTPSLIKAIQDYIKEDRCSMADSQVQHGILRCMKNNEQRVNQTAISMHPQRCNNKTQVPIYATKHLGDGIGIYLSKRRQRIKVAKKLPTKLTHKLREVINGPNKAGMWNHQ